MSRLQLAAMLEAAKKRAAHYKEEADAMNRRGYREASNTMAVPWAVALIAVDMLEAALAVTSE